ncbi:MULTISPECIES: hypothetical protein [unclassified Streptomyces]
MVFPDGPAVMFDGLDVGLSVAPDVDTVLTNYGRVRLEWSAPESSP